MEGAENNRWKGTETHEKPLRLLLFSPDRVGGARAPSPFQEYPYQKPRRVSKEKRESRV